MKNLLIVGGTGRNVGKTEFVCRLIGRVAQHTPVYGLKVSAVFPDEEIYHGSHTDERTGHLVEEHRHQGNKDTNRMLQAGASRVFYLQSDGNNIATGFQQFCREVPDGAPLVCESNSLGDVVRPALRIVVRGISGEVKPRAVNQLAMADLVVVSDGRTGFPELERIEFSPATGWSLKTRSSNEGDAS